MANAVLMQPRVRVLWGTLDLTCPSASETPVFEGIDLREIGPLVYDVRASLEDQGQTPTGSMKWNPSGLAFKVYEKCLEKFIDYSIMITFYYPPPRAKEITFEFYWGGQAETVGIDMDITVKLVTLFEGLINANFYSYVQADKNEKIFTLESIISDLFRKFGVINDKGSYIDLLTDPSESVYSAYNNALIKNNYSDGSTFMESIQNVLKVTGLNAMFSNVISGERTLPFIYVYGPYSKVDRESQVYFPYVLFPTMFQSFTRNYEWQPPQKSQEISSIISRKIEAEREAKLAAEGKTRAKRNVSENLQNDSNKNSSLPEGVYQGKVSNGVYLLEEGNKPDFEFGARNQDLFNKEKSAKLSLTTYACPRLIGIEPLNVILIPQGDGQFVEDWIVTSVEYQQTQGGVDISIQASRTFGLGGNMNDTVTGDTVKTIRNALRSNDSTQTKDVYKDLYIEYAWNVKAESNPLPVTSSPAPTSPKINEITNVNDLPASAQEILSGTSSLAEAVIRFEPAGTAELPFEVITENGQQSIKVYNSSFRAYLAFKYYELTPNEAKKNAALNGAGNGGIVKGLSLAEAKASYKEFTDYGLNSMIRYYGAKEKGLQKLAVSLDYPNVFPELFNKSDSSTSRPSAASPTLRNPPSESPQTAAPAPAPANTSTSRPGNAQSNSPSYQRPSQVVPPVVQLEVKQGVPPVVQLEAQPAKPAETQASQVSASEARNRLDSEFPITTAPSVINSGGKVGDPLFYVWLKDAIKQSPLPQDSGAKFSGNYTITGMDQSRVKFWYSQWVNGGRIQYLNYLQEQGANSVNQVRTKAISGN